MSEKEIDEVKIKLKFTGAADYRSIYDQEFTHEEAREAADFSDLMDSYFGFDENEVKSEMLSSFVSENMKMGQRLYMVLHLPIDQLGIMAMKDPDDRIVHIIKKRCSEINKIKEGRSSIILSGDF